MKIHEKYLQRCIAIARSARGISSPNPAVGAVIVFEDRIIGSGYTSEYGGPHAEVMAIRSVRNPEDLKQATLYVTLEPCSHHGKTPPCTDRILAAGIPRVYIGIMDPHDKVAGAGIRQLRAAGCDVHVGICEDACREHHRRFLTLHQKKRPYIVLKWAQSADGFLAPDQDRRSKTPAPYWITGKRSRQLVHKWRTREQAILIGRKTVEADNPSLTSRDWIGKDPVRILIDPDKKLGGAMNVLDGSAVTIRVVSTESEQGGLPGIEDIALDFKAGFHTRLADALGKQNIMSVIVEGGGTTLQGFLDSGCWDEARVFTGAPVFGRGLQAPVMHGKPTYNQKIGKDLLQIWRND